MRRLTQLMKIAALFGLVALTTLAAPAVCPGAVVTAQAADSDFTIEDGVLKDYSGDAGEVVIPDGVTEISSYAFYYSSMTSLEIPASVTKIDPYAICFCSDLASITVDADNTVYHSDNNCNAIVETQTGWLIAGCKNTVITDEVTCIGEGAFNGCSGLTRLTLPDTVTTLESNSFYGCGITSVEISANVISIEDAFDNCVNLTSIKVDAENPVYDSRDNCNAIIETETDTLVVGCKTTVIPNTVTVIGYNAFDGCTGLTSITIPESVTMIRSWAFYNTGLTSIKIPSGVTSVGAFSFQYCRSLTCVEFPSNVTFFGQKIFDSCDQLTDLFFDGTKDQWAQVDTDYITLPDTCRIHYPLDKTVVSSLSNTTSGVTVTWNQVEGADGYRVYRKSGSSGYSLYTTITSGDTTTYTDTAVTSGTTYTYAVRAYDAKHYSAYTGKSIKYLAPASVSALVNYSAGIQVQWTKITGAGGYYIYRKAGSAAKWSKVGTVTSGSTVKWNDTNTSNGVTYKYCIKAYSGSTMGAYKGSKTTYRITTPTISSVSNSAAGKATVKWNKNTTATGYQICYETGTTTKTITVSGNTNVSKVISGLTKGNTYKVKVRSYKKVGTTTYYGGWSARKSVKISK